MDGAMKDPIGTEGVARTGKSGEGPRARSPHARRNTMSTEHGTKGEGKRDAKVSVVQEPVAGEDVSAGNDGVETVHEAPVEVGAAPASKRRLDMTIEELREEFRRVTGRDTESRDRRYAEQTIMRSG